MEVQLSRATAMLELGRPELVDTVVNEMLAADPWEWRAVWMSGLALLARDDFRGAQAAFNAVYGQVPGELAPKLALALACERGGEGALAGGGLIGPDAEPYPFQNDPDTDENEAANCQVFPEDNLDRASNFRIQDFRYAPEREATPCGLTIEEDPAVVLQKTLGFHATTIDDHTGDSVLWFRPSSAGALGVVKEIASLGGPIDGLVPPAVAAFLAKRRLRARTQPV